MPKCLRDWCRSVLGHFGTGAEVSRAGPKCPVAEVSGNRRVGIAVLFGSCFEVVYNRR